MASHLDMRWDYLPSPVISAPLNTKFFGKLIYHPDISFRLAPFSEWMVSTSHAEDRMGFTTLSFLGYSCRSFGRSQAFVHLDLELFGVLGQIHLGEGLVCMPVCPHLEVQPGSGMPSLGAVTLLHSQVSREPHKG